MIILIFETRQQTLIMKNKYSLEVQEKYEHSTIMFVCNQVNVINMRYIHKHLNKCKVIDGIKHIYKYFLRCYNFELNNFANEYLSSSIRWNKYESFESIFTIFSLINHSFTNLM